MTQHEICEAARNENCPCGAPPGAECNCPPGTPPRSYHRSRIRAAYRHGRISADDDAFIVRNFTGPVPDPGVFGPLPVGAL
jgi:hypothetical protein